MTTAKRLASVVFVVFVLLALPQPAQAKTIKVGDGTPASCTEAALRSALIFVGGEKSSVIQFNCGAAPVTIVVTATLTIPDNTTIDGKGLITLDGQLSTPTILRADRDTTAVLRNLNIHRGGLGCVGCGVSGGGLLNAGTVTVNGCTFSGNIAGSGGGVSNSGTLAVHDSTFSGNHILGGTGGGGISSQHTLEIHGSTFTGNHSTFGAAIFAEGTVAVYDSVFDSNNLTGALIDRQDVVLSTPLGTPSGAIHLGMGTHTITRSTITGNFGNENGGGINLLAGRLTVSDSIISQNTAFYGGGIVVHGGTVTIQDSTIAQNTANGTGGGIDNQFSGALTVKGSAITDNTAGSDGGGIYGTAELINTLVTNNTPNDIAP